MQTFTFPFFSRAAMARTELKPNHPALQEIDPKTSFFYTPRTITALLLGASCRPTDEGPFAASQVLQCEADVRA